MVKLYKILMVSLVFLLTVNALAILAKAQDSEIKAEILPSEGTASTDILVRFHTRNVSIGNVDKADIFWDDFSIALNEQGVLGADGSYNYHLNIPTESPLSDVGNHTIRVDSYVSNYGQVSFNFTFNVTEYVPSPEYVALNSTYYSLLANYTDLLVNYTYLLANYSQLSTNYTTLSTDYAKLRNEQMALLNSLSSSYNSLLADYTSLTTNYNSMLTTYNNLHLLYASFLMNYTNLQGNFNSLTSDYNTLRADYDSLESSYQSLKSNYNGQLGDLAASRNLNYILIASTITLAAITVYLIMRKPKPVTKTRY